jgi:hypothetical protein
MGVKLGSLTLREGHILRVCENRVLRKIYGTKKVVPEGWRTQHSGELDNLYASPNNIRAIKINKYEIDGACGTHGRDDK